jgi:hypothetical protein
VIEVVVQVSVPLVGVTPTVGAVVLLLMVTAAEAVHPLAAVPTTLYVDAALMVSVGSVLLSFHT